MSFSESVRSVFRNYANFDGRASRPEYWWFQLFNLLVVLAAYAVLIVAFIAGRGVGGVGGSGYSLIIVVAAALGIYAIATFLPSLAVLVRRLHDTDRSGWWLLIVLIPYIGAFVLFVFLVLPSTPGINRFGPPYGVAGDVRRVNYRGPSPQETWTQYTDDAQRAAANGYQPVAQQWKRDGMGDYLEVTYTSAAIGWQQPGWQAPTWQQAPGAGGPPPGPTTASTQGGQHPFDGPPPDRPSGT